MGPLLRTIETTQTVKCPQKHQLWWNNFYHPFSYSIFHPDLLLFFVEKNLGLFSIPGNFWSKGTPLWWKVWKYFRMLFLISQIKRFGTLNATQKTAALYKAPFLKKSMKTDKNWLFLTKNAILTIFRQFFWFFQKRCWVEGCVFLRCVQCPKTFNLGYQKQHSELFLNFSP